MKTAYQSKEAGPPLMSTCELYDSLFQDHDTFVQDTTNPTKGLFFISNTKENIRNINRRYNRKPQNLSFPRRSHRTDLSEQSSRMDLRFRHRKLLPRGWLEQRRQN